MIGVIVGFIAGCAVGALICGVLNRIAVGEAIGRSMW